MQTLTMDKKLSVLFDRYKDRDFAANAYKEVEEIRRDALVKGTSITVAAFVANEAIRLTMRTRKYSLNDNSIIALFKLKI